MCEIVILAHIWDAFGFLRKIGCDKDGTTIKDLKYLSKRKVFPVPTLFITSLPEDEQHLRMGKEVGTMQF
jgi:hypothetical protein